MSQKDNNVNIIGFLLLLGAVILLVLTSIYPAIPKVLNYVFWGVLLIFIFKPKT